MTVEERVDSICRWNNPGLRELVIQLLRDQIEDCAKIADSSQIHNTFSLVYDGACREVANKIRALAEPEEIESGVKR